MSEVQSGDRASGRRIFIAGGVLAVILAISLFAALPGWLFPRLAEGESTTLTAWSTWILTAATIALFAGAIIAAVYASRAWREAKRANDTRDGEKRQEYANRVAAWVEEGGSANYNLILLNSNDVPVYDVSWTLHGHGELVLRQMDGGNAPIIPPRKELVVGRLDFKDAADVIDWDRDPRLRKGRGHAAGDFLLDIEFRDPAGRHWWRADDGELTQKTPSLSLVKGKRKSRGFRKSRALKSDSEKRSSGDSRY